MKNTAEQRLSAPVRAAKVVTGLLELPGPSASCAPPPMFTHSCSQRTGPGFRDLCPLRRGGAQQTQEPSSGLGLPGRWHIVKGVGVPINPAGPCRPHQCLKLGG